MSFLSRLKRRFTVNKVKTTQMNDLNPKVYQELLREEDQISHTIDIFSCLSAH